MLLTLINIVCTVRYVLYVQIILQLLVCANALCL